jgi:hypothetical protein
MDTPSLISADSKESPKADTQSKIEQQSDLDGAGFEGMSTPMQRRSLKSDMLTETNNMVLATSKEPPTDACLSISSGVPQRPWLLLTTGPRRNYLFRARG